VSKILIKLTIPMTFGIVGMVAFNLVDTYFVGRLGTKELAALSFTFPIVLLINSLAMGLGMGASAVISRAIGEGDQHKVQRLTTDSLVLALLFVAFFVVIGLLTIDPTFRLLGASPEILVLVKEYMSIWYIGSIFVVVPMVGNNAIRATGDTKTPSAIMLIAVTLNFIMDPLLIFGIGPFPRLGLAGAAITTVIARAVTFVVALYVLYFRDKMLTLAFPKLKVVYDSWKRILYIGIPTALTRVVVPLGIGVITRIISSYGSEAVAGYGVAIRIQFFSMTVIRALASVIGPFVGQNWGARKYERIDQGIAKSRNFSLIWGLGVCAVLAVVARPIASIFNDNAMVVSTTMLFLRIVPLSYGFFGITILSFSVLNVLNKPFHAALLSIMHMILFIALALLGSYLLGITGVFVASAAAYCIAGIGSYFVLRIVVNAIKKSGETT